MNGQPCWNLVLETLSWERIQKLRLKKFQRIFRWAYDHSEFHRSFYDKAGILPKDICSLGTSGKFPKWKNP